MSEGISYHNKDVLFKFLSELYKDTSLDAFGLQGMPKIKQLLPSNLPKVRADEKRSDTQFLLEDGSILMVEYESNNAITENHIKYLDYAQRILDRAYREGKSINPIHIVVIYTSDVAKVGEGLNAGDVGIQSKPILLSEYNGDVILEKISDKIERGEDLTQEELMKLSILPLMHSTKPREENVRNSVELAKQIKDERQQIQVIAGILTATDKFVSDEFAAIMRRWMGMTKVGRLIAEEARKEKSRDIARRLLKKMSSEEVADVTGLDIDEVNEIEQENE
ncbi:transcriptional regulator [Salicibibacter halophilus]|uniref:Transcriptional regulator n=1 Tax=Salicibibacter halophilus TaxID=2502791 RepID=A0A514LF07_9BACI|nr:transcriptional regulator [Salicibibacter halophilus]QDI90430.1 transcriptional regulator [Salicibibacter halophilus]